MHSMLPTACTAMHSMLPTANSVHLSPVKSGKVVEESADRHCWRF
jgi:hypothetical protein